MPTSSKKDRKRAKAFKDRALALLERYEVPFPEFLNGPTEEPRDVLLGIFVRVASEFIEALEAERSPTALNAAHLGAARTLSECLSRQPTTVAFTDGRRAAFASGAGCNHCCTQRVTVPPVTALCVARYLRKKPSGSEMACLLERLRLHDEILSSRSPIEQALRSLMCPLNVGGLCTVYHVRPLVCQGHHSFDLPRCIEARADPEKIGTVLMEGRRLEYRNVVMAAVEAGSTTLGLNVDELEFMPALRIALETPDAAARFLVGEAVFAPAHRPDVGQARHLDFLRRRGTMPLPLK